MPIFPILSVCEKLDWRSSNSIVNFHGNLSVLLFERNTCSVAVQAAFFNSKRLALAQNRNCSLIFFAMEMVTPATEFQENKTFNLFPVDNTTIPINSSNEKNKAQSILIIQSTIASIGIVANLTVIAVFLNHKKLRKKIPNIFIINQVRKSTDFNSTFIFCLVQRCNVSFCSS